MSLLPPNPSPNTISCQSFLCGRRPVSCGCDLQVTTALFAYSHSQIHTHTLNDPVTTKWASLRVCWLCLFLFVFADWVNLLVKKCVWRCFSDKIWDFCCQHWISLDLHLSVLPGRLIYSKHLIVFFQTWYVIHSFFFISAKKQRNEIITYFINSVTVNKSMRKSNIDSGFQFS